VKSTPAPENVFVVFRFVVQEQQFTDHWKILRELRLFSQNKEKVVGWKCISTGGSSSLQLVFQTPAL